MMLLCDDVAHDIVSDIVFGDTVYGDTVYGDGSNACHDYGVKFSQRVYFMGTFVKCYLVWRRAVLTLL